MQSARSVRFLLSRARLQALSRTSFVSLLGLLPVIYALVVARPALAWDLLPDDSTKLLVSILESVVNAFPFIFGMFSFVMTFIAKGMDLKQRESSAVYATPVDDNDIAVSSIALMWLLSAVIGVVFTLSAGLVIANETRLWALLGFILPSALLGVILSQAVVTLIVMTIAKATTFEVAGVASAGLILAWRVVLLALVVLSEGGIPSGIVGFCPEGAFVGIALFFSPTALDSGQMGLVLGAPMHVLDLAVSVSLLTIAAISIFTASSILRRPQ